MSNSPKATTSNSKPPRVIEKHHGFALHNQQQPKAGRRTFVGGSNSPVIRSRYSSLPSCIQAVRSSPLKLYRQISRSRSFSRTRPKTEGVWVSIVQNGTRASKTLWLRRRD